jgi:hypothetical protein
MFMARSSERLSADAYTRSSVEDYLQAAAEQRARIELAIAEAGRRRERAIEAKEWLDKHQESSPAPSDPHAAPEAGVGEGDGA